MRIRHFQSYTRFARQKDSERLGQAAGHRAIAARMEGKRNAGHVPAGRAAPNCASLYLGYDGCTASGNIRAGLEPSWFETRFALLTMRGLVRRARPTPPV